ncbi:MAG TPA: NAD-dependent epimerase/dehydratase family protein [bacterium]|nr:NAD-dependent epimerase/dehydratase family protein [bacterium]
MNKKILLTGGAGYIGSHTLKLLAEQPYDLWVYDDLSNGLASLLPAKAHLVTGDLQGPELEKLFKTEKFDAVIHDAAKIDVTESMADPYYYYHHNTVATLKLLRLMEAQQCRRLIFASTAAVYGCAKDLPVTENTLTQPTNHYGQSKLIAEKMILAGKTYGLKSVIFRFFNVAGVDVELGRKLKVGHNLLGKIIEVLGGETAQLAVFGKNCPTVGQSSA